MPRLSVVLVSLLLAACAAEPPACRTSTARDIGKLDRLIAESRANIDRGYARGSGRTPASLGGVGLDLCVGGARNNVGLSLCTPTVPTGSSGAVAIDLEAERRKLASMEARRAELVRRAAAEADACAAARALPAGAGY